MVMRKKVVQGRERKKETNLQVETREFELESKESYEGKEKDRRQEKQNGGLGKQESEA